LSEILVCGTEAEVDTKYTAIYSLKVCPI